MKDQSGKDWVALIAYLFDQASDETKEKVLRILDGEIGNIEPETKLEGRNE